MVCALLPLALWAVATHSFDSFDAFPYLTVTSPTPRCGKTRLLEVVELLVKDPLRATNASEAALFRGIQKFHPTLLLDEAETLNSKGERAEYMRAVINAGNRRGAHVLRCEGKPPVPEKFSVFCPKMIVQIGSPPTTILDRSVVIPMQRRSGDEHVQRFLLRTAGPQGKKLAATASAWATAHRADIDRAYTEQSLEFLADRDAEGWQPLFSVLAAADPARLPELEECARILTSGKATATEEDSLQLKLLADIKAMFESRGCTKLSSEELVGALNQCELSPWADIDRGRGLTKHKVSRMLRSFGITPRVVRIGDATPRGYMREDLEPVWGRYLAADSTSSIQSGLKAHHAQQASNDADEPALFRAQQDGAVALSKSDDSPTNTRVVADVAVAPRSHEEPTHVRGQAWYQPEPPPVVVGGASAAQSSTT
jgi:hypothetical protein